MSDARKNRRIGAVLMAAMLPVPAFAQTGGEAVLDRCRQLEDTLDRIACLEAAVRTLAAAAPAVKVPAAANAASPGPQSDVATIGAAQVEALTRTRDEPIDRLEAARGLEVEKFAKVGYRQLEVHLKNGQVWRQIRGDVQDIRVSTSRNPTVDIMESSLGGYRLSLNEIQRTIRVRRIR